MFGRSNTIAGSLFVFAVAIILSLSFVGIAAAQSNTSLGIGALQNNTTGEFNTAIGILLLASTTA